MPLYGPPPTPPVFVPVSGRLLLPEGLAVTTTTVINGSGLLSAAFGVLAPCAISAIGCDITTLNSSAIIRSALYAVVGGLVTLLYDATADGSTNIDASVATGATGYHEQTFAHNQSLSTGTAYVLGIEATGGQPVVRGATSPGLGTITASPADLSAPLTTMGWRRTGIAGAFPSPFVANAFGVLPVLTAKVV